MKYENAKRVTNTDTKTITHNHNHNDTKESIMTMHLDLIFASKQFDEVKNTENDKIYDTSYNDDSFEIETDHDDMKEQFEVQTVKEDVSENQFIDENDQAQNIREETKVQNNPSNNNNEHIHDIDINDITVNDQPEYNNANQQIDQDLSK